MFTKFDTPWLMIQGGGAETYIRTLPVYTYMRTFAYYEAGMGAAMAVADVPDARGRDRDLLPPLAAGGEPVNRAFDLLTLRGQLVLLAALALLVFTAFPFALDGLDRVQGRRTRFSSRRRPCGRAPSRSTNLERLFAETRFLTYFRNSLKVSLVDRRADARCRRRPPPTA